MFETGQKLTTEEFLNNCVVKGLMADEQETSILLSRERGFRDKVKIYTSDNTFITKIKKAIKKNPSAWEIIVAGTMNGEIVGFDFVGPVNVIRIGSGKKRTRNLTDEQRKALGDRLRKSIFYNKDIDEDEDEDDEDDEFTED